MRGSEISSIRLRYCVLLFKNRQYELIIAQSLSCYLARKQFQEDFVKGISHCGGSGVYLLVHCYSSYLMWRS